MMKLEIGIMREGLLGLKKIINMDISGLMGIFCGHYNLMLQVALIKVQPKSVKDLIIIGLMIKIKWKKQTNK